MVLEIEMFRTPEGIAAVKESQRRRYADVSLVDQVVEADELWRKGRVETASFFIISLNV